MGFQLLIFLFPTFPTPMFMVMEEGPSEMFVPIKMTLKIIVLLLISQFLLSDLPLSGWSDWSSWSSCNPECFQHRSRQCTSKRKKYCQGGPDLENRNCTDGFCKGRQKDYLAPKPAQNLPKSWVFLSIMIPN